MQNSRVDAEKKREGKIREGWVYRLEVLEPPCPSQKIMISSPSPRVVVDRPSDNVENVESRVGAAGVWDR